MLVIWVALSNVIGTVVLKHAWEIQIDCTQSILFSRNADPEMD